MINCAFRSLWLAAWLGTLSGCSLAPVTLESLPTGSGRSASATGNFSLPRMNGAAPGPGPSAVAPAAGISVAGSAGASAAPSAVPATPGPGSPASPPLMPTMAPTSASPPMASLPVASPAVISASTDVPAAGRGFPLAGPWGSFYGPASGLGDLDAVARQYRIINLDADPAQGNIRPDQIAQLKAGGRNRVISYFNLGAVESTRDYWDHVPAGFVAAKSLPNLGPYAGYPQEVWMSPANADWQHLLLDYVAPRLVATGIDGFYFDNLELLEHAPDDPNGPCDAASRSAGWALVAKLRERYPSLLFVMQNGTGDTNRLARVNGQPYAALLDGVAHEDVFTSGQGATNAAAETSVLKTNDAVVAELTAWQAQGLRPGGRPFWVATEDYVNTCSNTADARQVYAQARTRGFAAYVSNSSASQVVLCPWGPLVTGAP